MLWESWRGLGIGPWSWIDQTLKCIVSETFLTWRTQLHCNWVCACAAFYNSVEIGWWLAWIHFRSIENFRFKLFWIASPQDEILLSCKNWKNWSSLSKPFWSWLEFYSIVLEMIILHFIVWGSVHMYTTLISSTNKIGLAWLKSLMKNSILNKHYKSR